MTHIRIAAHISAIYLLVGCGWILVSDWLAFGDDHAKGVYWIATVKGLGYVLTTAALLFVLIRRYAKLLGESEKRFRVLIESAPDAVMVQSAGRIVYMNAAALRLIGASSAEQLIGRDVLDIVHPDSRAAVKERIATVTHGKATVACREETYQRLDGAAVVCEISATPILFESNDGELVFIRDATERKGIQEKQSHAQKMEFLQQLAGKIAHALNNLVQVINGNADLARTSIPPDAPAQIYLSQVLRAGRQATDWVGKIMSFSCSSAPSLEGLEVSEKDIQAWASIASPQGAPAAVSADAAKALPGVRGPASSAERRSTDAPVVLLAEDDEMVRRLTERFLKQAGYTVLLARDGVEAVELFEAHGHVVSAAVFDIVMPRMSGFDAYERIRKMDAHLPVVFASGFSGYRKPDSLELIPGVNLVQKPFDCNELVAMVRQAIESSRAVGPAGA